MSRRMSKVLIATLSLFLFGCGANDSALYGLSTPPLTKGEFAFVKKVIELSEVTNGELDGYTLFIYKDLDSVLKAKQKFLPDAKKCIGGFTEYYSKEIHTSLESLPHEFGHIKIRHRTFGIVSGNDHTAKSGWDQGTEDGVNRVKEEVLQSMPYHRIACSE